MAIPLSLLQVFCTMITFGLAVVGWRYRFRPGGRPFVALAVAISVLSGSWSILMIHPEPPALKVAGMSLVAFILVVIPYLWILFALDYTGYGWLITKRTHAVLSVVPLATLVVLLVPSLRELYWGPANLAQGPFGLTPPFGPVFWLDIWYGYPLMVGGALLLVRLVVSEDRLYADQSAALVIGGVVPLVVNVLIQLDVNQFGFPLQPASFTVTAVMFSFALFRFELFNLLPATRQIGRDIVLGDIQEGVLIADTTGQFVDANEACAVILDEPRSSLLGQPVKSVFGDQAPSNSDRIVPSVYQADDGQLYEVTASQIRDRANRPLGTAFIFRDITDRKLRETQLEVLNRVLRHNLRNKLTVIQGQADILLQAVPEEQRENVEKQLAATADLKKLGERAREFESLKTREDVSPRRVEVATVLENLVKDLRSEFPAAAVTVEVPSELGVETYPDALVIALENLLRNAAVHNDRDVPTIEVTGTMTDDSVEIVVKDDGPGIPEHELAVLEADAESALEHGSGLGLWITKWAVQYLGGDLTFDSAGSRGTKTVVTVPKSPDGAE